jgi:hypothetical protein
MPPVCSRMNSQSKTWPGPLALLVEKLLHDALQQRRVTVDPHRQKQAGNRRPTAEQLERTLGMRKAQQRRLGQRIHGDDLTAALRRFLQHRHHARVIRPRILPEDEDRVGLLEVIQLHRAFADAHRLFQRHPARLVTEVGTVGQVVGPELPHQQLKQKRRLVAGPSRGVKRSLVRRRQRPKLVGNQTIRGIPGNRLIVRPARRQIQRLRQTPELPQLIVTARSQLGDAVTGEKVRVDAPSSRLPAHRLGAVFTKLDLTPLASRLGPGTAGTVHALGLIDLEQRPHAPQEPGVVAAQLVQR